MEAVGDLTSWCVFWGGNSIRCSGSKEINCSEWVHLSCWSAGLCSKLCKSQLLVVDFRSDSAVPSHRFTLATSNWNTSSASLSGRLPGLGWATLWEYGDLLLEWTAEIILWALNRPARIAHCVCVSQKPWVNHLGATSCQWIQQLRCRGEISLKTCEPVHYHL